ncbi:uncharacterized protein LOC110265105 [Arachis ipaensis]|uniref:uncharacterized protein LOC110265105 n=1 Tax=Arachis ipaensis TaxID=130454 RepID=UPI000A2B32C1|nr:uncharacterized protein LOC110265105 [Arachis ipaensis]
MVQGKKKLPGSLSFGGMPSWITPYPTPFNPLQCNFKNGKSERESEETEKRIEEAGAVRRQCRLPGARRRAASRRRPVQGAEPVLPSEMKRTLPALSRLVAAELAVGDRHSLTTAASPFMKLLLPP